MTAPSPDPASSNADAPPSRQAPGRKHSSWGLASLILGVMANLVFAVQLAITYFYARPAAGTTRVKLLLLILVWALQFSGVAAAIMAIFVKHYARSLALAGLILSLLPGVVHVFGG